MNPFSTLNPAFFFCLRSHLETEAALLEDFPLLTEVFSNSEGKRPSFWQIKTRRLVSHAKLSIITCTPAIRRRGNKIYQEKIRLWSMWTSSLTSIPQCSQYIEELRTGGFGASVTTSGHRSVKQVFAGSGNVTFLHSVKLPRSNLPV